MKRVNELLMQIAPMRREIKERCINYLKDVLERTDEHRIEFYDEDGEPYGGEYVSVTYDGGNHPEYATNAFSNVRAIFLDKKGNLSLDTEDDSDYDFANITWDEVVAVATYVDEVLTPNIK